MKKFLHLCSHLPVTNPCATESALPVILEIILRIELFPICVLERGAANEDLKKGDAEGPDIGFARVVRNAAGALR